MTITRPEYARRATLFALLIAVFVVSVDLVRAEVVSLEFASLPDISEWEHLTWCTPEETIQGVTMMQELQVASCKPEGDGDSSTYRRPIEEFNGTPGWFFEFRVATTGDRAMIPFAAPTVVVAANSFGILYHVTMAEDQIKFLRDVTLPILFFDVAPREPHTIRLELAENPDPRYSWFIDGALVDEGSPEGSFPVQNSRITFHGKAFNSPTDNTWHYIRYGDIPVNASGDFDSDGEVDDFEVFYFDECLSESGGGVDAGPGCRWADMDSDTDVDCDDYELFADAWTSPGDPPTFGSCTVGEIVPATSDWGVAVLALHTLTTATLLYRPRRALLAG